MSEFVGAIKPPCGRNCELRGSKVCHTDDCPYGWKEYQAKVLKKREREQDEKRRRYL